MNGWLLIVWVSFAANTTKTFPTQLGPFASDDACYKAAMQIKVTSICIAQGDVAPETSSSVASGGGGGTTPMPAGGGKGQEGPTPYTDETLIYENDSSCPPGHLVLKRTLYCNWPAEPSDEK